MALLLVLKRLRHEKLRVATAILGIAAATALVVWSLGLTLTAMAQSRERVRRMTAPFSCWITSDGTATGFGRSRRPAATSPSKRNGGLRGIPEKLTTAVRALPGVETAHACSVLRATLDYRPDGRVMQGPPLVAGLTLATAAGCPYTDTPVRGVWPDPASTEPEAAFCSAVFAARHLDAPPLGTPIVLVTRTGTVTVKISAIIDLPQTVSGFPTVFTTAETMRQARGGIAEPVRPNLLLCHLRDASATTRITQQIADWAASTEAKTLRVVVREEIEQQVASDALRNFKRQTPLLLTLAALTALCILVNTLIVGIEQQARVLALLRLAGMTARQVAGTVALEGALTAVCGWALGLAGGWTALLLFVARNHELFPEGVRIGWQTPVATAAGVTLITGLGLLLPWRRARRIRPLDALTATPPAPATPRPGRTWLGIALLFPMLALALPLSLSPLLRSLLLLTIGLPIHFLGIWLCLPAFIRSVERLAVPLVSTGLCLDRHLLLRHDGRRAARTARMVLTLTVGLGSFIAIHVWGSSMMAPFLPSPTFPDVIVSLLPQGVTGDAADRVATLPGIADNRCLAIEAVQRNLNEAVLTQISQTAGKPPAFRNVLLFGVAPQAAFGGEHPLAPVRFTAGERHQAAAALARGNACLITQMFARQSGFGIGDTLALAPDRTGDSATFTIAGIVDLNWHLVTSRANLRGRGGMPQATLGPVFVSETAARRVSGNTDTTCFLWANLSPAYRARGPLPAGQCLEADIRELLAIDAANTVRVHHRDEIEDGTIAHGAQLIGALARVPFWSLIVLTSGIAVLLVASVRARAREIAVMRAVGMTRGQLGRMLLGETLLTAFCGVALSLVSGLCIGWTFTGWTRAWMPFGGLPLTLSVPWPLLARGAGFACILCLLMALPPILWLTRD